MKKIFLLSFWFVSGCVALIDENFQMIKNFPIVAHDKKVSVALIIETKKPDNINEENFKKNLEKNKLKMKQQFEKSQLFKKVYINNEKSDYTIRIKSYKESNMKPLNRPSCLIGNVITGITYFIIPSFCEYPAIADTIVEVEKNKTNDIKYFIMRRESFAMGLGIVTLLMWPFNMEDFQKMIHELEITYDNIALQSYQMIKNMEE